MKRPLLLVEALATRNDSGLGAMARLFVDGLCGLADFVNIKVLLPQAGSYQPGSHCESIAVRPGPARLWTDAIFPYHIAKIKPDAVFCLGQHLPKWRPKSRYALAIPDAGPLEDLGWKTSSYDAFNRRCLQRMAPAADTIVTISDFTKSRLVDLLGIPTERIHVIRPIRAVRPHPVSTVSTEGYEVGGTFPQGNYFLSLGNVEPRKNFPGLIAAYAALKQRRPEAPPLYIAGHKAWGVVETESAIQKHSLQGSVFLTGYLSNIDRLAYLKNCRVYIASSLYEGWGLPLFEALELGKPAIYHAGSSQEEFAQGLAIAVNCSDPAELSRAIEKVWSNEPERHRLTTALNNDFPKILAYDLEGALRSALMPLFRGLTI